MPSTMRLSRPRGPYAKIEPYFNQSVCDFQPILEMIQLIINGQPQRFPISNQAPPLTRDDQDDEVLNITQLLEHLALQDKRIAIERNGEIVPRSKFDEQVLNNGDRLEIVVAVGGG